MSFYDKFSVKSTGNAYFVGANTPSGFKCDFPYLFSEGEYKKVIIIKGGSGTGKSTVMRRLAKACENAGATATYLLCSSDPDSLDGVLLEKNGVKIAVVDGTAPHTLDPVLPGACGEIFNSGDFWNTEYLEEYVGEISEISERKKGCYSESYRYISGASEVFGMINTLARRVLLEDKMNAFTARFAAAEGSARGTHGCVSERRTYALSMKGAVRLPVFDNAQRLVSVEDSAGILPLFMKSITDAFVRRGYDVTVSVSPFGDIWEVGVSSFGIAFVPRHDGVEYYKNINLRRFTNIKEQQDTRQKRRFGEKCLDALLDGAIKSLEDAWRLHSELEEIYVKAMDFEALDRTTARLAERLCKYFSA